MESDSRTHETYQKNTERQSSVDIPSDSDLPEPFRLRRSILHSDAMDRILLGYNFNILPWLSLILWIILLAAQKG